jgi:hypothetical protein
MHSPPRKLSSDEQAQWKIPPAVSSWKNAKGYIIPLDKRLAADGRGLQENTVSDGFAKLSEALYVAERKAREEVEARAKLRVAVSRKQKEQQEMEMRNLAAAAREKRTVGGREAEDEDVRQLFYVNVCCCCLGGELCQSTAHIPSVLTPPSHSCDVPILDYVVLFILTPFFPLFCLSICISHTFLSFFFSFFHLPDQFLCLSRSP